MRFCLKHIIDKELNKYLEWYSKECRKGVIKYDDVKVGLLEDEAKNG
jgi:hypothetical protein